MLSRLGKRQFNKSSAEIFRETSAIASRLDTITNRASRKRMRTENISDPITKKSRTNSDIYSVFNVSEIPRDSFIVDKEYVSATKTGNYLMDDPLLDWFKMYYYKRGFNTPEETNHLNDKQRIIHKEVREAECLKDQTFINILFNLGNQFEDGVFSYIRKHYSHQFIQIRENKGQMGYSPEKKEETLEAMKAGIPIIIEGHVVNEQNKTFGWPDLMIRSDFVNRLFTKTIILDSEEHISAKKLGNNGFHYVVVDIKWSTLKLTVDGEHLCNSNRMKANKGQILIYNCALGEMQGFYPKEAYLMGRSWYYTKNNNKIAGHNCFDTLGKVDFTKSNFDQHFLEKTREAIRWYRECRLYGKNWKLFPPENLNLYPNMSNNYDAPYHSIKKAYAYKIKEHTLIAGIGPKQRNHALDLGIMSFDDPRACAKNYGMNPNSYRGKIIDRILEAYRQSKPNVIPNKITNNNHNWQNGTSIEFFIDFEECDPKMYDSNVHKYDDESELFDSQTSGSFLFMFGVATVVNGKFVDYYDFSAKRHTNEEEIRIIDNAFHFMEKRTMEVAMSEGIEERTMIKPNIYHWTNAEITTLKRMNWKYGTRWENVLKGYNFVDGYKIFEKEPVSVTGALNNKLKTIAKTMHEHKMIKTTWGNSSVGDGYHASRVGAEYYKFMNKYDFAYVKDALEKEYFVHEQKFKELIEYNRVDCVAVFEILDYLRKNHGLYRESSKN